MRRAKDKMSHSDKMLDAALVIRKQIEDGEDVPEIALIVEHKAAFYNKVFATPPMPKTTEGSDTVWWTFNAELAEHYELITPFMIVAGHKHGLMTYPITQGKTTESKSMKLMGVNDDGMLIALEILHLTGGTVEDEFSSMDELLEIREKFRTKLGAPVINDPNALFKGLKKEKGPDS